MLYRALALLCAATLVLGYLAAAPISAIAQADQPGTITIVVTDAATKQPLRLARVLLDGPVITTEFTDDSGRVYFVDVPDGIYRARIITRGYNPVTSTQFEVLEGKAVTVAVALAPSSALKVIATVSSKSTATVSTSEITDDSAQRKLSNDLAGALNKLSGVSVSTSSTDSDATETISLNGEDASQTALTLDGIPLNAPGTAGDLGSYATDLFTGASVSMSPQAGGLAGGVNFSTAQPTLSWVSDDTLSTGTDGEYYGIAQETGSFGNGRFGVAATVSHRLTTSLLDGMTYLDASGLDYSHNGDRTTDGELFKLRYNVNDEQTLTGEFMSSTGTSNFVRTGLCGDLPCGYGPNNTTGTLSGLYSLSDDALLGDTSVVATIYSSENQRNDDLLDRYLAGVLTPTGYGTINRTHGITVNAVLPAQQRHTLSISAYSTSSSQTTIPFVSEAVPYYNGAQSFSYSDVRLNDTIQSDTKLILNESFGLSAATNSPTSILASAGFNWQPTQIDGYAFSYSIGGTAAHAGRSTILTDPDALSFDCEGDIVQGSAPGDQPGRSSSTSAQLSYTHKWSFGEISASFHRQVQNGIVLPLQVDASAVPGILPPGYLNDVQNLYDSPGGCGAPTGTPFDIDQLYFNMPVGGVQRVYQGVNVTGFFNFGNLNVQPFYDVTGAEEISGDPRIDNPYSTVISGAQVRNVPLHRGGLTLDYKAPHSAFEYLADAQYTSVNNTQNLPAYTTFDLGVQANLSRGYLVFAAQNLTDTYAGIFETPIDAVPYQTVGGATIATLARPLTPRSVSVTYHLRFGQGVAPSPTSSLASSAGGGRGRGGFGGGGGGFRGGGGGAAAGFRGGRFSPIGSTPPSNPLDVNQSQACTTDDAKAAHAILDPLKAFVARIEAAKTASGYPATMAVPDIPGIDVTYHGLGTTYALTIVVKSADTRGLFPCLQMHFANADEVKAHDLYQPPQAPMFTFEVNYMPAVGLYIAPRPPQAGQESFRLYQLPTTPPKAPFEIITIPQCTATLQKSAAQELSELKKHFASGTAAPDWTITAHTAKAGTWYELTPNDVTVLGTLITCGRIATASRADLTKLGWDGAQPPSLNYTPAFGLYIMRNTPGARNGRGTGTGRRRGNGQSLNGGAGSGAVPDGGSGAPPPDQPPGS